MSSVYSQSLCAIEEWEDDYSFENRDLGVDRDVMVEKNTLL